MKIHPTAITSDVGDVVDVLVYYSSPVAADTVVTAVSSDPSVMAVTPSSKTIFAGESSARFTVEAVSAGTSQVVFDDSSDVEVLSASVNYTASSIDEKPSSPDAVLTGERTATINVLVEDVDTVISKGLSKIRFQVSEDGGLSYRDLTTASSTPASVETTVDPGWSLDGKQLHIADDVEDWDFEFIGPDPWTAQRLAEWINNKSGLVAEVTSAGSVRISTDDTGLSRHLQVTGGAAATELGLDTDMHRGTAAHVSLVSGTINYVLFDTSNPAVGNLYRIRYESDAGDFTAWGNPGTCRLSPILDQADLCKCYVNLVNQNGNPLEGFDVIIGARWSQVESGGVSYAIASTTHKIRTDSSGHAEIWLIQGQIVTVTIPSVGVRRTVKIPDQAEVSLFDPSIRVDNDWWSIVVDDVPDGISF